MGTSNVNIEGGTFTSSDGYTIFLPQPGTSTISGGTFEGAAGTVVLQQGTLNIKGGEFIANGSVDDAHLATGDGTRGLYNATLAIAGNYGDYKLNITGGTFTAKGNATTVTATVNDKESTNTKDISVSGATFSDLTLLTAGTDNFNVSGSFKLSSDISVDSLNIKGSKNVEVDLNSKIVTVKQDVKSSSAVTLSQKSDELVFKNGTITVPGSSSGKGALSIEKGRLILDNATFSAPDWSGAFFIQKADAYLEVRNQSHLYARAYGFTSNATTSNSELTYGSGAEIHLSDSYFNSTQTGFMMNVPVKVYIKNCEFSGNHQAAYLRGGEYEIENSTFKLNATLPTTDTEYRDNASTWGSGNAAPFAAVVIGNRASNAYQYPTTVTFKGTQSFGSVSDDEYKASYPALFIWGETGYPVTVKGDLTGFTANGYDYDAVIGGNVDVSGATLPSKVNDQREAASSSTTE
jgi:phage baseplate assembly protein gpV